MTDTKIEPKFAVALNLVQAKLQTVKKTKTNPFFKSKYADLATVWDEVRAILTQNGFSVVQTTGVLPDGKATLITRLLHVSGESIVGEYPLNPTKNDPQQLGAAVTYARRYALQAILGVTVEDEDDDGNASSAEHKPAKQAAPAKVSTHVDEETGDEFAAESVVFIPEAVTKKGNRVGIKSPAGDWYGSFNAAHEAIAKAAKEKCTPILMVYTRKGDFKNVLDLKDSEE